MTAPLPRLRREDPAAAPNTPAPRTDLVDGWVRLFTGLLRFPGAQSQPIAEELESHLHDRTRDLMLTGLAEPDAMRRAVEELGEAADVAARYRALRTEPRRRLLMHAAIFGSAAALGVSIAAVTISGRGTAQPPTANTDRLAALAYTDQLKNLEELRATESLARLRAETLLAEYQRRAADQPVPPPTQFQPTPADPYLAGRTLDASFKNSRFGDILPLLGKAADAPVVYNEHTLEGVINATDAPITLQNSNITIPHLLDAISEQLDLHNGQSLDARLSSGTLVIGTRAYFDRRESTLATYDLSSILAARQAIDATERTKTIEEIVGVITEYVSPDDWTQNGGTLARLTPVGDRLFVQAPARFFPQITWILNQLPRTDHSSAIAPAPNQNLDTPHGRDVTMYRLSHAAAADVAKALRESYPNLKILTDDRTNSLIVSGAIPDDPSLRNAVYTLDAQAQDPATPPKPEPNQKAK